MPGNAEAGGEAAIGSGRLLNQTGPEFELPNTSHAVSADGSVIFWSSGQSGHVYARIDGERTLEVPGPASCKASEPLASRACFLTATPDGGKALLANGVVYGLNGAGSAYEEVADLTGGEGGFQGILGASEDLSRVYFVDTKDLGGEGAVAGEANLYAWHEGTSTFVATLLANDGSFGTGGRYGAWRASPSDRTAQASADGRFLAFMSRAPLTGYDNATSAASLATPALRSSSTRPTPAPSVAPPATPAASGRWGPPT